MPETPSFNIEISEAGRPEDREPIALALQAYNDAKAPPHAFHPLALLLKNTQGEIIGGLWGASRYEWLFIEILFVPEALRCAGLGRTLMRQAEQIARDRKMTGIWLDTFDFQARPFYEKLGFTIFGELKDHPRGISQYWLQKRL